ncbi:MAG: hypothetical protein IPK72_21615 [Candidatus Eisenbacteria bacterium]|nr:hypothetical protein [Candidatus Eisenbacteria bacterium]
MLLKLTTHTLAVLESEAVEYLDLLARLLEGRYQALKAADEQRRREKAKAQAREPAEATDAPATPEAAS